MFVLIAVATGGVLWTLWGFARKRESSS
jgi:hypothetical protein